MFLNRQFLDKTDCDLVDSPDISWIIDKFIWFDFWIQEKNRDLVSQQTDSSESPDTLADIPTYDFKAKFLETKAQAKVQILADWLWGQR